MQQGGLRRPAARAGPGGCAAGAASQQGGAMRAPAAWRVPRRPAGGATAALGGACGGGAAGGASAAAALVRDTSLPAGALAAAQLPGPRPPSQQQRHRQPRVRAAAALGTAVAWQPLAAPVAQRAGCLHGLGPAAAPARQHQQQHQQHQQQQLRQGRHACCAASAEPGAPGGGGSGGGDAFGRVPPPPGAGPPSWDQLPDPWDPAAVSARASPPPPPPPPPPGPGPNGRGMPNYENTDWGWDAPEQNWDPAEGLSAEQIASMEADYDAMLARQRSAQDPPRDKWITPLLDWQSITGAFDPDQSRTEDAMADEALTNKSESREAIAFAGRLVVIPILTGALVGRALAEPVLGFTLANNPDAFAMTGRQKIEGASKVHQEEARMRMLMAIGQAPPLTETEMLRHLREFAIELQEEERHHNENSLTTLVCDSVSAMVLTVLLVRDVDGRTALFSTIGRLFEGLSDIAKAVMIILIADTMLGYHSEEGWTGLIDVVLGHYGIEVEEEEIVIFVGVIPIMLDVLFKYWIFIGLNKISPGAVVTIKQLDRH